MKSTIETFAAQEKSQFRTISEYVLTLIEEGIFKSIQESLRRQLVKGDTASETVPWGTYTATQQGGANGGNININLSLNEDFQDALNDPKGVKAMYQEEFSEMFMKLFTDYVMYGRFFTDETESEKTAPGIVTGVRLSEFLKEYFPNTYGAMILKAARDHRADGEVYKITLCDNVPHGTMEFEYNGDDVTVTFVADKAFKQYLKNDAMADA